MVHYKVIYFWTIIIELTLCISPAIIVALARLKAAQAKALANAWNWKARNNYNVAMNNLKNHKGLLRDRYVRDSGNFDQNNFDNLASAGSLKSENDKELVGNEEIENDNFRNKQLENGPNQLEEDFIDSNNQVFFMDEGNGAKSAEETFDHLIPISFPFFEEDNPNFGKHFEAESFINDINNMMPKPTSDHNILEELTKDAFRDATGLVNDFILGDTNDAEYGEGKESKSIQLIPFTPITPDNQPEYQDPNNFNPLKPENRKDMVKFIDEQDKIWKNLWPNVKYEPVHYNGPKELSVPKLEPDYSYGYTKKLKPVVDIIQNENASDGYQTEYKINKYDTPSSDSKYQELKPPLPLVYPVEISPPTLPKIDIHLIKFDPNLIKKKIEELRKQKNMYFDKLEPVTDKVNKHIMEDLEVLNSLIKIPPKLPVVKFLPEKDQHYQNQYGSDGYVGEPLQPHENHFHPIEVVRSENPLLSYIIQVPDNYPYFRRSTRSVETPKTDYINALITEAEELLKFMKKLCKHNEQMSYVEHAGESILDEIRSRVRVKRNVPVTALLTDPSTKVDLSKTLENLGILTKTIFEHQDTPMYHIRNLVGATKDVFLATIKIPNQNFITPSAYNIVENPIKEDVLQAHISSRFGDGGEENSFWPHEVVTSTFQQVGNVIRNSVRSGQEAVNHVGEIANHAKKAIISAKTAPLVLKETIIPIPIVPTDQVNINSRFGFDDNENVGAAERTAEQKFVNVGNLLDAVGVSNPQQDMPQKTKDGYINKVVNDMTYTLGIDDIHDFIMQVKGQLNDLKKQNYLKINEIKCGNKRVARDINSKLLKSLSPETTGPFSSPKEDDTLGNSFVPLDLTNPFLSPNIPKIIPQMFNQVKPVSNLDILHPLHTQGRTAQENYMDSIFNSFPFKPYQVPFPVLGEPNPDFMEHSEDAIFDDGNLEQFQNDNLLGPILGAANPEMMEQLFNERITDTGLLRTPEEVFTRNQYLVDNDDDERVATLMKVTGSMLLPFMGKVKEDKTEKYFNQFKSPADHNYGYQDYGDSNFEDNYYYCE